MLIHCLGCPKTLWTMRPHDVPRIWRWVFVSQTYPLTAYCETCAPKESQ